MSFVYHKSDGEILAVTERDFLVFPSEENVKVTAYPNLPTNVDYTFYKMSDKGVLSENVEKFKEFKLTEITESFEKETATRNFMTSFGIIIDNRRSGVKNDKENVTSLIKLGQTYEQINGVGSYQVPFKSEDGTDHYLNLTQLSQLEIEMIQDGFYLYQKKWTLEAQTKACSTNSELKLIKW